MYKILFVDDDPLILRRLHQILDWSSMGFQILPDAADGLAALEIMKNEVPDVMICDINMPNMDGLQLAEQVRDTHPNVQCVMPVSYTHLHSHVFHSNIHHVYVYYKNILQS